jgi:crossover junction endodeoxyribonuclease RuvC
VSERRILGIDPGMARTGYGVVVQSSDGHLDLVACGVISTPAGEDQGLRLLELEDGILAIIQEHHPATSAVEKLFFERNVSTAMSVGQARGVAMLTLARRKVPVAEYAPAEIKQAVAGYGAADKRQMQIMVQRLLRMEKKPTPDDAADALAIAICHAHASRTMERLEAGR